MAGVAVRGGLDSVSAERQSRQAPPVVESLVEVLDCTIGVVMNFYSAQRVQKKSKKSAPRKPKIRWHLLGLADPIPRDNTSSIDVIRLGVASLAKEYPFALYQVAGKPVVRQESETRRNKTHVVKH